MHNWDRNPKNLIKYDSFSVNNFYLKRIIGQESKNLFKYDSLSVSNFNLIFHPYQDRSK